MSIALAGLEQADTQLDAAASQIAQSGAATDSGGNPDVVDLSAEMVALTTAQNQFNATLETLNVADQVQQNLLDVMA